MLLEGDHHGPTGGVPDEVLGHGGVEGCRLWALGCLGMKRATGGVVI